MLKSIAEEVTVLMAANDIIKTEEIEAYTYGLELIIPKVILYAVILVVSLITDTFLMSVAFVILLMCLRRYSGGFHCKTAEICVIALSFILILEFAALIFEFRTLSYLSACSLTANAVLILLSQIRRCKNEINNVESRC